MFALCAYLFLWVPDLDLAMMGLLHHRSILTHSLLPALPLWLLATRFGPAPAAGALLGLGAHLASDMLSPMVGYAQIWLPFPIKSPLGAAASYLWLALNACIGFALASIVARAAFGRRFAFGVVALTGALIALTYGALYERSLWAILLILLLLSASLTPEYLSRRRKARGSAPARFE